MNKQEWIQYCLDHYECIEDYPFDETTAVMKVKAKQKMFALIAVRDDRLYINLKCDPDEALTLRDSFEGIAEGWHMNKKHWNTVWPGSDVPEGLIFKMIDDSFDLVKPKVRKRKQ